MSSGNIKFNIEKIRKALYISVTGRATFEIAYMLEKFCLPFLEKNYHLEFDFSKTTYLDSTFLGIMALFTRKSIYPIMICNATQNVFDYFKVLNIHTYFEFTHKEFDLEWFELPLINEENSELIKTVIDAHEELIKKGSTDSNKFKSLVESLRKALIH